MALNTCWKSN